MERGAVHWLLAWLLAATQALLGCADGSPEGGGGTGGTSPPECQAVEVTNDITTHTTWTDGNVYVIRAWNLHVEATLTVEPGVVVKFHSSEGPELVLGSGGTLVAKGTSAKPIVWTSYKDDAHCGDTNGDGSATTPAREDWQSVRTNGENGSVFEYNEFYYGGAGSYFFVLDLYGSSATVRNSTFAHNKGAKAGDYYEGALDAGDALAGTVITGNVFYDNVLPLRVAPWISIDDSNTFHNPANPSERNTMNGVFVACCEYITTAVSWRETEVAFVVNFHDFYIETGGGALSLGDNVVVKFTTDGELLFDGTNFNNTTGPGVAFTSFKDDTLKGDTNGDGSATMPSQGDWQGIYDSNTGQHMTWGNIYYDSN